MQLPMLLSSGVDGTVRLWGLSSGTCEAVATAHSAPIRAIAATDDFGLTGSADATAKVQRAPSKRVRHSAPSLIKSSCCFFSR